MCHPYWNKPHSGCLLRRKRNPIKQKFRDIILHNKYVESISWISSASAPLKTEWHWEVCQRYLISPWSKVISVCVCTITLCHCVRYELCTCPEAIHSVLWFTSVYVWTFAISRVIYLTLSLRRIKLSLSRINVRARATANKSTHPPSGALVNLRSLATHMLRFQLRNYRKTNGNAGSITTVIKVCRSYLFHRLGGAGAPTCAAGEPDVGVRIRPETRICTWCVSSD